MGKMKLTKPILAGAAAVTAIAFAASAFGLGAKPVYVLSKMQQSRSKLSQLSVTLLPAP